MTITRTDEYLISLVREFCKATNEAEWLEFKENKADPEDIGQYISALANSAAYTGKAFGYMVWGVTDSAHEIVGTTFRYREVKIGNEELESWLLRLLQPKLNFRFHEVAVDSKLVCILEIERAQSSPVRFSGSEYIRVGSYTKLLKDYQEKERALWRIFDKTPFEAGIAAERQSEAEVLDLLDFPGYFDLTNRALPEGRDAIVEALASDKLVVPCDAGGWNITNMGALLFAKKLERFPSLSRKSARVVIYKENDRINTIKETIGHKGYAVGFQGLISFVNSFIPSNEIIGQALRRTVPMFPELAVRELVANALIHQDLSLRGSGPMVEIFNNRIEITNPGTPLVDTQRFVDTPPWSRN